MTLLKKISELEICTEELLSRSKIIFRPGHPGLVASRGEELSQKKFVPPHRKNLGSRAAKREEDHLLKSSLTQGTSRDSKKGGVVREA